MNRRQLDEEEDCRSKKSKHEVVKVTENAGTYVLASSLITFNDDI